MNHENKARESRANAVLALIESGRSDAGDYPETVSVARPLSYRRCEDGGFALAYVEASPGFLPSDFERRWNPETKRWEPKELGVDLPCQ